VSRPGTLRNRLALVAVLTTSAWVIALTALFNVLLSAQLHHQADRLLRTRAQAVLSTLDVNSAGRLTVRETPNDAALDTGIWVYDNTGVIDRPRARPSVQATADRVAATGRAVFADAPGHSSVRLFAQPARLDGRRVGTVVSAINVKPYLASSRTALVASVGLALALILGAYLATRHVVARALAPVVEMAGQAERWSAHDVGQRFGRAPRPAELQHLAEGLDALLDRIAAALRHEQQLAAEISHELRTPLAVVAAETELLRTGSPSDAERRQAYATITETTTRMDRLLDALLAQAASDATEARGRCVVRSVVDAAIASAAMRLPVRIHTDPEALEAGISPEVLERILTPLLGNANRFGQTFVAVSCRRSGPDVELVVADDGPGVPDDFRDRVFEPGQRADPGDGHPGAGLGLALARRLARSVGGDLTLEPPGSQGAAFAVRLPA
jgi:signal transduction histidine kinase